MSLAQKRHNTWAGYLAKTGKTDRKGTTLTDQQKLDLNPWHPIWDDRARHTAQKIRHRIGESSYQAMLEILPDEVDDWSHQQFAKGFDRALLIIDNTAIGQLPDPVDLAIAMCATPLTIHPYKRGELQRPCTECGTGVSPHLIDPEGYLVRCDACGFIGHFQDKAAVERWEVHINEIKERFFAHLT